MGSRFVVVLAVALGFLVGVCSSAQAAQRIELSVTDAWYLEPVVNSNPDGLNYSFLALDPGGKSMKLKGTISPKGNFRIPASQFSLKPFYLGLPFNFEYRAERAITGQYSARSGKMTMNIPLTYLITADLLDDPGTPDVNEAKTISCGFVGIASKYQTSGSIRTDKVTFRGKNFARGNGQLLGGWSVPSASLVGRGFDGTPDDQCQNEAAGSSPGGQLFSGKIWLRADVKILGKRR